MSGNDRLDILRVRQIFSDFTDLSGRPSDWPPATNGEITSLVAEVIARRGGALDSSGEAIARAVEMACRPLMHDLNAERAIRLSAESGTCTNCGQSFADSRLFKLTGKMP